MIYNLLLIAFICVAITDIAGFPEEIKRLVWKWVFKDKREYRYFSAKPFDCSLCQTFWVGLIFIILSGAFTLENLALVLLSAVFTPIIKDVIILVKDIATKIMDTIYWYLNLN